MDADEVPWDCQRLIIYKFSRGATQVLFECRSYSQEHPWEVSGPVWTREAGSKGNLQMTVKALNQAIGLRVIGCSMVELNSQ